MEHSVPERKQNVEDTTDARVRRSREGLRQALLDLLQSKPLDQITIRDIAAQSGVGYTTYYRHYASKEALLDDITAEEIRNLCDLTIPVYDAADSYAACLALCTFVDQHRLLWTALLTGGAAAIVRDELLRQGREASSNHSLGGSWLPAGLGLVLAVSTIIELMVWWLKQAKPLPASQIAEILDRVAIGPTKATTALSSGRKTVTPNRKGRK